MTTYKPLFEPTAVRGLSQASRSFRDAWHPFLSTAGHNQIRSQLSIIDWLLLGSLLQSILILASPLSLTYSLAPTFFLLSYKITKTLAITLRLIKNPHLQNILPGRQTAIFPNADGTLDKKGAAEHQVCVFILAFKCNQ